MYLEDRVQPREVPHGGHSDDLGHQVSVEEVVLELVELEVGISDPGLCQEPGEWGI